jgi:hypothetical protein
MLNGKKVINFLELNPLVQEFEKTVTLLKSNTLEIKLYGLQGSFITLTFLESYPKIDVTPPVLTITNPADGMLTNQKNLTTQGKVTDQSALTLTINGTSQPVLSDGTFSKAFTLAEGKNTLTFIASDSY